jgi:hypothetical protein
MIQPGSREEPLVFAHRKRSHPIWNFTVRIRTDDRDLVRFGSSIWKVVGESSVRAVSMVDNGRITHLNVFRRLEIDVVFILTVLTGQNPFEKDLESLPSFQILPRGHLR